MKCEITWCENERTCLYYCHDHHVIVCVEDNSNISALRRTPHAPDTVESVASVGISSTSEVLASEADSAPATSR
jgi:hypothetical protein